MSGVQHENTPKKGGNWGNRVIVPQELALLSLYPLAAAQAGDFYPADTQIITGDVSDISYEIQPLSGGTNKV